MAAGADKARFFLESSVSELREWERRELFSRDEISAITAKRSAFEHTLNARGAATPAEWARYISYEMNLDALRRKRVARKKMKATAQGHAAQQRIFLLLDRATRKFPGTFELWLQYIEYGRKQHSNKKVSRIFTDLLRLHPTKDSAWIYAAKWAMETQGDVQAARSFLQRGLRFCKRSKPLYLEYARLEMGYIARIQARRQILGLSPGRQTEPLSEIPDSAQDTDMIELSSTSAADPALDEHLRSIVDESAIEKLVASPAMTGAIPVAIFDAAMKTFNHDQLLAEDFFNLFFDFGTVPCAPKILDHVIKSLILPEANSVVVLSCQCRKPLAGIATDSPQYPSALGLSVKSINASMSKASNRQSELARKLLTWLGPLSETENLAPELQRVLTAVTRRLSKQASIEQEAT